MRNPTKKFENDNISFYRYSWGKPVAFHLTYECHGYSDDERPQIHIAFLFWSLFWSMPWSHKRKDYGDSEQYGCYWYQDGWQSQSFVIRYGKKSKYINMPWNLDHVRHSIKLKDGTWVHSIKGDKQDFYKDEWKEKMWRTNMPYVDKHTPNGELNVVNADISISEREWRMRWFKRTTMFSQVSRTIDVEFSSEVGKRRGSWKGGTTGCGERFDKHETWKDGFERLTQRVF